MKKQFCKKCGIVIRRGLLMADDFSEFEDGIYCGRCARKRVEDARR